MSVLSRIDSPGKVTAARIRELGLTLLEVCPSHVGIVCPHCGGARMVSATTFREWGLNRRVPPCRSKAPDAAGACKPRRTEDAP